MNTRSEIAWLARRAGWGLAPGELDELTAAGTSVVLDRLTAPDQSEVAPAKSPWAEFTFEVEPDNETRAAQNLQASTMWLDHLAGGPRPFEDALAWFWHDHFAVSAAVVNHLPTMLAHLELLRTHALGNFREMIRAVTVDAAMLVFLDGATSTGLAPNENYGRELQELYTLGIGNYTEADVRFAAVALTGWAVRRRSDWKVVFLPQRHDDTRQILLGTVGVHDVDSVVDTILDHPAVATRIAGKMADHFLGPVDASITAELASTFEASSLNIAPLARAVLEAGVAGGGSAILMGPVPWLVQALKATGAELEPRAVMAMLRNMGQVPGLPPSVGGYPDASAWLSSSSTAARFNSAGLIAARTAEDAPALRAAVDGDWRGLADVLVRPDGFTQATTDALKDIPSESGGRPGVARLAVALSSVDLLIA